MRIYITSQMRTGSTWLSNLISDLIEVDWLFLDTIHNTFLNSRWNKYNLFKVHLILPETICSYFKPEYNDRAISIVRNFKDMIVSTALFFKNSYDKTPSKNLQMPSWIEKIIRKNVGKPDKVYVNDFVLSGDMNHFKEFYKKYNSNFKHEKYMKIKYEDLHNNTLETLKVVCKFLEIEKSDEDLVKIIENNTIEFMRKNNDGRLAFSRKGGIGDWKNWLNPASINKINNLLK